MNEMIRVYVINDPGAKYLRMRYTDPVTGKRIAKSTGTTKRKGADRIAAKWEADLQEGRYKAPSKITWEEFRERYEAQAVPAMAIGTFGPLNASLNSLEKHITPQRLRDIDAAQVTLWQQRLRNAGLAEATIRSYSTHVRAALNWAHAQGLLPTVPKVPMPKRARKSDGRTPMKGRPITTEEFERMLAKTADVVGKKRAESWKYLLRGLWLSGLRIGEASRLRWDDGPTADEALTVDMMGSKPMLRVDAGAEKGNRDRFLPIAPEFAEMLLAVPDDDQSGWVFNPMPGRNGVKRPSQDTMERTISAIGKAAGVKVLANKSATAHDLRRSFGTRWAVRVMPVVLQTLMRHVTIETTLRHYVDLDALETMDRLYEAMPDLGHTLGHTTPKTQQGVQG